MLSARPILPAESFMPWCISEYVLLFISAESEREPFVFDFTSTGISSFFERMKKSSSIVEFSFLK